MKRSIQNLSHYKLLTCELGNLIPITWYEALPGDSIQHMTQALVRVTPPVAPIMHPVKVRIHYWYVPNRFLWENWESFITGGKDGLDTSEHPYIQIPAQGGVTKGSLFDHMGVPVGTYPDGIKINAFPFLAYNEIFNQHYRDQDLVEERVQDYTDGQASFDVSIAKVSWEKDYFTTSRPWEQKGPQVTIPLGANAPVVPSGDGEPLFNYADRQGQRVLVDDADGHLRAATPGTDGYIQWNQSKLEADLSAISGVSVNDLRFSLAVQRYQEARAHYGSRYVEYLKYIGIRNPSDARLQNPEYLGGGAQTIQFSEVLQTAQIDEARDLGELGGHGIAGVRTRKFRRFFEEHGIVMALMSVVPKSIYGQGLERPFSRHYKEDYFQKELAYLGDQEVYNKEIYAPQSDTEGVFGYQKRYNEYRGKKSNIAGDFRDTLDFYHYAREFATPPALNSDFVECSPTKRVYREQTGDPLWIMTQHNVYARRMMPFNPNPRTF